MKRISSGRFDALRLVALALGCALFVYAALRAVRVPITIDEVQTFYYYIQKGFVGIFKFDTANNHVLNTLLAWLVTRIAGTDEFALRLPNLLAFALYLVFSYRILARATAPVIAVCGFVLLNVNPYLLDFFSLCRGYGLSLGLLMPALYYLLKFVDETRAGSARASRSLTIALGFAGAAVLANFTVLLVYLSIVAVAGVVLILAGKRGGRPGAWPRKNTPLLLGGAWGVLALILNFFAFSQDLILSPRMFEPLTVRISGLSADEQKSTEVVGLNVEKWDIPMALADGVWSLPVSACTTGLVLKIPAGLIDKVEDVEIRIGSKSFHEQDRIREVRSGPREPQLLVFPLHDHVSLARPDIASIAAAINWKGRPAYNLALAIRLAVWLAVFAAVIGLGLLAGAAVRRLRTLDIEPFLPIWNITLALAAVVAGPIYLLKQKGEFYIGGAMGFMNDTVLSLVNNSLYGRKLLDSSHAPWIYAGCAFVVGLAAVGLWRGRRDKPRPALDAALASGSILLLAILAVVVQHSLLHMLYLSGRTALFFLPLAGLFLVFAFAAADTVPKLGIVSRTLLAGLAVLILLHFATTANTSITVDWRLEADQKTVLADLERMHDARSPAEATIRLGLEYYLYPGMVYLKERRHAAWLQLDIVPPFQAEDYYYLSGPFDESRMVLIKQYPTGNILVKAK